MANKAKKKQVKDTKEEKFDFNEEIVIGLTRIEDEHEENKKKSKKGNKVSKKNSKKNSYKKKNDNKEQGDFLKENKPKNKPEKKLTKKQELARRKRKAIFRVIKWTSLIMIIIGGTIYTLLSPIFNIKNISVVGNSKISNDEIISLSKIQIDNNMFKYQAKKIQDNIKQNAYIESIKVKRKLPDSIELIVEERKATYMIQIANAYAYIDNQGYILEISDKDEKLPILLGTETMQEEIHAGNRLCTEDLKKLNDVLKIMESANSNGIANLITKINIKDSTNYILTLSSNKKTVYLGDISNLSTKMLWIIKFNEEERNAKGIIFLNMNLNNENSKPYFRKDV